MNAASVVALYRRLTDNGVPLWIEGGWGIDALLGEQTRPHDDLDIVVEERHLLRLRELLESDGFGDVPRPDTRAWNFVLGHPDGRMIDVHVVVFDASGRGIYGPPENGEFYPAQSFEGVGTVDGLSVRCLSVDYQLRPRDHALRDKDIADAAALRARFGTRPT
jgi:lincosamide nucleotidyltransferase A/C/D/E